MIQTRKLDTLCVKTDLTQNTLKSMLAKSSPLTNLLAKFDNFKKAVFVSRLCVNSFYQSTLLPYTGQAFNPVPLPAWGFWFGKEWQNEAPILLQLVLQEVWGVVFQESVVMSNWDTRSEACQVRRHPTSPETCHPASGRPCHPTHHSGRDPCDVTLLHFFQLKPPSSSNRHWPCALATSCCSSRWLLLPIFVEESRLFQAWLVESDYGHGPSCSTTYHTVYSTVFDTFFEKRCSKVMKTTVCITIHRIFLKCLLNATIL